MKILFLTEGTTVPASRFRVGQFIPHFESRGIDCTVRAAYGDWYNAAARTAVGPAYKLLWRLKRVGQGLDAGRFDVVFLQRPALPFSALPERAVTRANRRTIFDVDDSIFLGAGGKVDPARRRAFEDEVELARHVICGNSYLAEEAGAPEKTTVIPTVIDTDRYVPAEAGKAEKAEGEPVVIGWMGTSGNFPFLEEIAPALREVLEARPEAVVRFVSNAPFEPLADHPRVEQIPWSKEREIELLQSFDIGLMPLEDSALTRGKCGFKMIQYMAVGTPVVVSAVGANVEIFEGSGAGFLADSWDAWCEPLLGLVDDAEMRKKMGVAGRVHAVESYSVKSVIDRYIDIFERVAEGGG